jgi:hypothetical protein
VEENLWRGQVGAGAQMVSIDEELEAAKAAINALLIYSTAH